MSRRFPPSAAEVAAARHVLGIEGACARGTVISAWKAALRITHPDTVDASRKADAEERTKVINEAKQTLIEAIDRGFPDGVAPQRGPYRTGHTPAGSPGTAREHTHTGRERAATTAPAGRPPRPRAPASRVGASRSRGRGTPSHVHVPSTPRWTPAEGRWLLIGALVVACLLAIAVVALTRDADSGEESRIDAPGTTAPAPPELQPVPTVSDDGDRPTRDVTLGAEPYAASFIEAAHDSSMSRAWWQAFVHPRARRREVQDVVLRLADSSVSRDMVELASRSVTCDLGAGPGTGQSRCTVTMPEELMDDLEFRTDGDAWKLVGYWHGA